MVSNYDRYQRAQHKCHVHLKIRLGPSDVYVYLCELSLTTNTCTDALMGLRETGVALALEVTLIQYAPHCAK